MDNGLCSFIAFSLRNEQEPKWQRATLKQFHLLYIYSCTKNTNPFLWEDLYSLLPLTIKWSSYIIKHLTLSWLNLLCVSPAVEQKIKAK